MMKLANLPKKAGSAPRRALLLTVIAWMNIAMAPCAMAFGDAPGCLHASMQADMASMADHDGHGGHGGHGGHDGHGMQHEDASGPDCGLASNDCCATQNDGATDSRGQKTIDANDAVDFAPFEAQRFATHATDTAMCRLVDRPPGRFTSAPPIHVLNCVYRD